MFREFRHEILSEFYRYVLQRWKEKKRYCNAQQEYLFGNLFLFSFFSFLFLPSLNFIKDFTLLKCISVLLDINSKYSATANLSLLKTEDIDFSRVLESIHRSQQNKITKQIKNKEQTKQKPKQKTN